MVVPSTIRIITVYDSRDPEDGGPSGDYSNVEVFFDTVRVAVYGDHYHDSGLTKAKAFVAGARYVWAAAYGVVGPQPHSVDSWPTK